MLRVELLFKFNFSQGLTRQEGIGHITTIKYYL